ncbi:MAG: hypothetical protein HYW38_01685 [Candidatus Colwellbacteria bacterium]|nr:hypothetical protein [Candidatus Wildermuthbacteria bacterium]MBI2594952.1 hypothetical protein [Candidatus Colwellbacteria bacterium]
MARTVDTKRVAFFEKEVQSLSFSDRDVKVEWYTLSQGMNKATQDALTAVLKKHRPHVAESIERELEQV